MNLFLNYSCSFMVIRVFFKKTFGVRSPRRNAIRQIRSIRRQRYFLFSVTNGELSELCELFSVFWHQNDKIKEYRFFIAVKRIFHCSENFLSLQWKLSFIAVKTFNHCDENFLSFDSAQTTSLLRTTEKAFLQMGKWPSSLTRQSSAEGRWKRKKRRGCAAPQRMIVSLW